MLRSVLPPTIGNNQGMGEARQDLNRLLHYTAIRLYYLPRPITSPLSPPRANTIVRTTDDFTKSVHALGFYAAPKGKERKIATRTSSSTATSSMAERCSARF